MLSNFFDEIRSNWLKWVLPIEFDCTYLLCRLVVLVVVFSIIKMEKAFSVIKLYTKSNIQYSLMYTQSLKLPINGNLTDLFKSTFSECHLEKRKRYYCVWIVCVCVRAWVYLFLFSFEMFSPHPLQLHDSIYTSQNGINFMLEWCKRVKTQHRLNISPCKRWYDHYVY